MRWDIMRQLRRLRFVKRWIVIPTNHEQSVAEHTFSVLWIYRELAKTYDLPWNAEVVDLIIDHDRDESITGDVPGPSKKRSGPSKYKEEWQIWVKVADMIEAGLHAREEINLGNNTFRIILKDVYNVGQPWFDKLANKPEGHADFRSLCMQFEREIDPCRHPLLENRSDGL